MGRLGNSLGPSVATFTEFGSRSSERERILIVEENRQFWEVRSSKNCRLLKF